MIEPNKVLFEMELNRLYTEIRLEPHLSPEDGEGPALLSIAVSLKRIADVIDRQSCERRMEGHKVAMVSALWGRYVGKGSAAFSAVMKAVDDFFKDKSP